MPLRQVTIEIVVFTTLFSLLSCGEENTSGTTLSAQVNIGKTGKTDFTRETSTISPFPEFPFGITLPWVIHTCTVVLTQHVTRSMNILKTADRMDFSKVTSNRANTTLSFQQPLRSEIHSITSATRLSTILEPKFSWFGPELFCLLLGPPGFNCWFSSAPVFQWCCSTPQGSPGVGRNTFLSSPHLCFIIVFICDLFVSRDVPLMS